MKLKYPLILGSNSPRRQQILRELGVEFTIRTIDLTEEFPGSIPVDQVAGYLAKKKAEAFEAIGPDTLLLTADTVVACDARILGKPGNEQEAAIMLETLSGRSHQVYTGTCLRLNENFHLLTDRTAVSFRKLTREEIDYYVHHYMPLDKAGAYGIQEWIGMIGIDRINGSYYNVVGLPVARIYGMFQSLGLIEF